MTKNYQINLTTLTTIHIGSGDSYDPTQFFIDSKGVLNHFNTSTFLENLEQKDVEEFSKICLDMNYVGMFRFFRNKFNNNIECRKVKVAPDIANTYEDVLNSGSRGNQIINQLELKRTIFNDFKNTAYIPGSSLKGCLKTAWMSNKAVEKNVVNQNDVRSCENAVLGGSFSDDPFRFVRISDLFPEQEAKTMVLYATNHSKAPEKNRDRSNLTVAFEVILPGSVFKGSANLEQPPGLNRVSRQPENVRLESLAKAAKEHYFAKLLQEEELLAKLGCMPELAKKIKERAGDKLFKTVFPVRIGHHSGAEFLTLDGNRRIQIRQGPKPPKISHSGATTIWLASTKKKPTSRKNLVPFGWALLEFVEEK